MNSSIYWIADISSNHCNNLQLAKDLIYAAKELGANYAKFQYWEVDNFINKERFDKLKIAHQKDWGQSVYDAYKQYQLNADWIPILYDECEKVGIEFMLSNYELSKIDEFDKYIKTYKIGSGDIDYIPMLEKVASKGKPIFLGCGASTDDDVREAFYFLYEECYKDIILFQCNTNYSSNDLENKKYLNLGWYKYDNDDCSYWEIKKLGLSDHTKSDIPIIASIALGVRYIERHLKLDDNDSPDSKFSLNPKEWKHMVKIANQTLEALGDGEKRIMDNEKQTRIIQRRGKDGKRPDLSWCEGV